MFKQTAIIGAMGFLVGMTLTVGAHLGRKACKAFDFCAEKGKESGKKLIEKVKTSK